MELPKALKTWPEYFEEVWQGRKTFEVRKNDREFTVGDTLILSEWLPATEYFTGREVHATVTYILYGGRFGVDRDMVIMALQITKKQNVREPLAVEA